MDTDDKKGKILYRKTGGGFFRFKGRFIKSGDTFWAFPHEIPKAFEDTLIELDTTHVEDLPNQEDENKEDAELQKEAIENLVTYTKEKAPGVGWYNVVDSTGKKVNEKSLREKDADEMVDNLNQVKG